MMARRISRSRRSRPCSSTSSRSRAAAAIGAALALGRRAGGRHERDTGLGGDYLRQAGLAEPRRPGEQNVVERLAAAARRLDEDLELLLDVRLADEVGKAARPERLLEVVL